LFGARAIVPFWFPVLSLFLVWPLPYLALLERALGGFTHATASVVGAVAPKLGLATPEPSAGAGAFLLHHGPRSFSLSIGSACSGRCAASTSSGGSSSPSTSTPRWRSRPHRRSEPRRRGSPAASFCSVPPRLPSRWQTASSPRPRGG